MSNIYPISILFSIIKEFTEKNQISLIQNLKGVYVPNVIFLLLDGVGDKEFEYMDKLESAIDRAYKIKLINRFPNTKEAYKQIFNQGKSNIEDIIKLNNKRFLLIDNRIELSLFGSYPHKIHRKDDYFVFDQIVANINNFEIIWGHIMMIDHATHDKNKRHRALIPNLAKRITTLIKTLSEKNYEGVLVLFGDHGPHEHKLHREPLTGKDKSKNRSSLIKSLNRASKTAMRIIPITQASIY